MQLQQTLDIPFVPTTPDRLATMIELANVTPGQRTADLGSGDGRIVLAFAKLGAQAHGYELSRERALLAQQNIEKEGFSHQATIHEQSFWDVPFTNFDIITIYGITSIMERLERKVIEEVSPGVKILSNAFQFPHWQPLVTKNNVFLYVKT